MAELKDSARRKLAAVRTRRQLWPCLQPLLRLGGEGAVRKVRQMLWPSSMKHMHEFPLEVDLLPDPADGWHVKRPAAAACRTAGLSNLASARRGRCVIAASGPSARTFPWQEVPNDVFVLGVNGAVAVTENAGRPLDGFLATDPDFFQTRMSLVGQSVRQAQVVVLSFLGLAHVARDMPELLREAASRIYVIEPVNRYFAIPRLKPQELASLLATEPSLVVGGELSEFAQERLGWSNDIRKGVFTARTVAYTALQTAAFMGFDDILLAGADFTAGGRAYAEPDGARPSKIDRDFDRIIGKAFALAFDQCRQRDIAVYNSSSTSRLQEILPYRHPDRLVQ